MACPEDPGEVSEDARPEFLRVLHLSLLAQGYSQVGLADQRVGVMNAQRLLQERDGRALQRLG